MAKKALSAVAAIGFGLSGIFAAMAQPYPTKPIKLVVSTPAGTTPDVIARAVAERLSAKLGQPVIVDNRPGARQAIALKAVATAEPDGYTLLLGTSGSLAINPAFSSSPDLAVSKNFVPVALLVTVANLLAVAPEIPADTVAELVAYSKANPGKLSYGAGVGTALHLLGAYIRAVTGADIALVPYRGTVQSLPDLFGGRIHIIIESRAVLLPYIQQGKLKPLVVTSETRMLELLDVPTLSEAGIDGYPPQTWMGIAAPPGTPDFVVARLNAAVNEVLNTADTKASLVKLGLKEQPASPQDFGALIATDTAKWAAVVKAANIQLTADN